MINRRRPDMDIQLHDAQDNAHEALQASLEEEHLVIYEANGCDYEFEIYDTPDMLDGEQFGVRVACFSYNGDRDGKHVWSCGTTVGKETRIIDAVRAARKASEME